MTKERVQELLQSYANNTISEIERKELYHFLKDAGNEPLFVDALLQISPATEQKDFDEYYNSILDNVYRLDKPAIAPDDNNSKAAAPVYRLRIIRKRLVRYAAAILVLAGLGTYFYFNFSKKQQQQTVVSEIKPRDIDPGGNKAMLTLSDGTTITLDSAADGALAQQGASSIIKLANGQIIYKPGADSTEEAMMNTMTTPRGGQYQLVLPDGSGVWLNAASSITYPVVFTGKQRIVKITGEVYFEVAKNKEKPFIIDVNGRSMVRVFGTSFNINSYADDASTRTTLLEGSVRVISEPMPTLFKGQTGFLESRFDGKANTAGTNNRMKDLAILKPGQQAVITGDKKEILVKSNIDIDQVMAWKNGFFNFQNASLPQMIQQLERWYDIQVRYEGSIPEMQFKGKMHRGVMLSVVINWFADLGIKSRLEGKTLVILNN
ncbi:MAG: FecR family protein [Ferruginibacter sp.]